MKNLNIPQKEVVLYKAEDGQLNLEVKLTDETVWLSQKQMSILFDKDIRTINEHIKNIYKEKEVEPFSTIRKFRIVQTEGKRKITRTMTICSICY